METTTSPFLSRLERLIEGESGSRVLSYLLIPLLIIAAVVLPPVSGPERILSAGHSTIGWDGGAVMDPDGTQLTFPAEGLAGPIQAKLTAIPRVNFLEGSAGKLWLPAAEALPNWLIPKSPLYTVSVRGTMPEAASLTLPIPNDAEPYETLDLYTWNTESESWEWLPSQLLPEDDLIEAHLDAVPGSVVVMQTNPRPLSASADLLPGGDLPVEGRQALTEINPAGLSLGNAGTIEGNQALLPESSPDASYGVIPTLRNWDDAGTVRTDLINNLLISSEQQETHIAAIEALVTGNLYAGIDLDYRGVDPALRMEYGQFIDALAKRLHLQSKRLSVRVEAPLQLSADRWETYGYDWQALGQAADVVCIPAIVDPRSYAPGGQMEALLDWTVGQIERSKVQLVLPSRSVEKAGPYLLLKGYSEALAPMVGPLQSTAPVAVPGDPVNVTMLSERQATDLAYDGVLGAYSYQYRDNAGDTRTVWLENAASLAQKMALAERYHLRGVTLQHLLSPSSDPEIWGVARRIQEGAASPSPSSYVYAWTVTGSGGNTVASDQRPLGDRSFTFPAPQQAGGELRVEASIADRGRPLGDAQTLALSVASATPVPTPTPTLTPTPEPTATPEFTPTPQPTPTPSKALLVVNGTYNVRTGPGTNYGLAGQVQAGQTLEIVGKNADSTWWQICCVDGEKVWISASLAPAQGPTGAVAVAADIPPAPTPAPQRPSAPAAVAGACTFGYGIQAHMVHNDQASMVMDITKSMGFNWVKQQVEWSVFEPDKGNYQWGALDGIVGAANNSGINLLFSVVNAPRWARPGGDYSVGGPPNNPQDFADFLGALSGKYCGSSLKALEVWNEQNLHYEWGNQELNPAAYIALLKPSYAAIKAACPSMVVISGALTPAGSNPGRAVDDFAYLEGMLNNGLANYCDAIGVHPSGYNLGPDVRWEQGCEFITQQGSSFRGACDSPHHSWSFRSTMEGYWNYLNAHGATSRCLWPTEFGWAAGGAFDPRYGYADDNTLEEQAEWTTRAYQIMKNEWGFVGPAFLWNLNFRVVANGTEKAQWGIVDPSWGPLLAFTALQQMPK